MSPDHRDVATIGIGGPVGSGKTALVQELVPILDQRGYDVGVIANDIMTQEDADRLQESFSDLLPEELISGVETGACPHTGIREDPSMNIAAVNDFVDHAPDLDAVIIESGGDNLAATFDPELADYFIFVISVAEGDDIPRKRGPGVVEGDLLVINKVDLAEYVDADVDQMLADAETVRDGPTVLTNCRASDGITAVADHIEESALFGLAGTQETI